MYIYISLSTYKITMVVIHHFLGGNGFLIFQSRCPGATAMLLPRKASKKGFAQREKQSSLLEVERNISGCIGCFSDDKVLDTICVNSTKSKEFRDLSKWTSQSRTSLQHNPILSTTGRNVYATCSCGLALKESGAHKQERGSIIKYVEWWCQPIPKL